MTKAINIASYICRTIKVDPLKLQKLLYYTQAVTLVRLDKPAFFEEIEAWDYGPVIREVYKKFRHTNEIIEKIDNKFNTLDPELITCIDIVIDYYGSKSGSALVNETHSESPWKDAYKKGKNTIISKDVMKKYYSSIYTFE